MRHSVIAKEREMTIGATATRGVLLLIVGALTAAPSLAAGTIGNLVFLDDDGDGIYESAAGEAGVSGVTVKLYDPGADVAVGGGDDVLRDTTTTNASGAYSFTGLPADNYYVEFVAPTNRVFTLQDQGADDSVDSDSDVNGQTAVFALGAAEFKDTIDCGLVKTASVGDLVFVDDDADGIQDSGEDGLKNVTVRLYDAGTDTQVDVTTTNSSGAYAFTGVTPDDYYIKVDLPTDYFFSPQDQGSDDEADSDVDAVGKSANFTLDVAESEDTIDVGLYEKAEVSGIVYLDDDGDGIQDAGEGDLAANATVKLFSVGADGIAGTGDDAQVGADVDTMDTYSFTDVEPGNYYLTFTPPAGLSLVPMDRGSDDTVDSDVDPDSGETDVFALSSGANLTTVDGGMAEFSTIGDFVFLDADEDGVQDGGETGVEDALVYLYSAGADGEVGTSDDELITNTRSDDTGAYQLSAVAGDYYLRLITPNGYSLTSQDEGSDDTLDSDPEPNSGRTAVFTLAASAVDNTRDAGLVVDTDNDGTPDSEDNCPEDPGKTEPGECGCGTSDADSDDDGVLDCDDNCPFDANTFQNDSDGDGIGDACEDSTTDGSGDGDGSGTGDLPRGDTDGSSGGSGGGGSSSGGGLPMCGACAPIGLFTYGLSIAGYAALLTLRRARR